VAKIVSGLLGEVVKDLNTLEPGQVLRWTLKDGRDFAVMSWDDFEHVAGTALMTTRSADNGSEGL
jgi:hypothetical protein